MGLGFGCTGTTATNYRTNFTAEQLEVVDGFGKELFYRAKSGTRSETQEVLNAWGIQASGSNDLAEKISSVSYTKAEDTLTHDTWTGNDPRTAPTAKLIKTNKVLIRRVEHRLSVQGKGDLPTEFSTSYQSLESHKIGRYVGSFTLYPALAGSISISISSASLVWFITDVTVENNLTDFWDWSAELIAYEDNTSLNAFNHMVNILADFQNGGAGQGGFDPTYYTASETYNLGEEDWVTRNLEVTWYDDSNT